MKITITGKTESTISFNTLGINLRGKISFHHVDLKNDEQIREVNAMRNAGLIDVQKEDVDEDIVQPVPAKTEAKTEAKPTEQVIETDVETSEEVVEKEEVEDAPSTKSEKTKETKETKPAKRGRGRPKGSPNKSKKNSKISSLKTAEGRKALAKAMVEPIVAVRYPHGDIVAKEQPKTVKTVKSIKKVEAPKEAPKEEDEGDKVVVMSGGKAIKTSSKNSYSGEIPDGENTRASIEALKRMEAEEAGEKPSDGLEDESKLPIQDRMGNPAVISTGQKNFEKIAMKNSVVPEAQQSKDAAKFVPLNEEAVKAADKKARAAFIDNKDEDDEKEDKGFLDDPFIET